MSRCLDLAAIGCAILILALAGCSEDKAAPPTDPTVLRAKRELVAAYYEEERLLDAEGVAAWILQRPEATPQDFVNAAAVDLGMTRADYSRPRGWVEEALRRDPTLATAWYCLGWLDMLNGDLEASRAHYKRALEFAPDDIPARYMYAMRSGELGHEDVAMAELHVVLEGGIERVGSFYLSAENRLQHLYRRKRTDEEWQRIGDELFASYKRHLDEGWPEPKSIKLERGYLGRVQPPAKPTGDGVLANSPRALPFERVEEALLADAGVIQAVKVFDVDRDQRPDVVAVSADGVHLARQLPGAKFDSQRLLDGDFREVRTADLANRGRQSLLLLGALDTAPVLLAPDGGLRFTVAETSFPATRDALFADYDHEGDLDLVVAGPAGLSLLRNDGLPADDLGAPIPLEPDKKIDRSGEPTEKVTFTLASAGSGLPTEPLAWVRVEDFDGDNDVDFLCGTEDGRVLVCSNLRRSEFEVHGPEATGIAFHVPPLMRDLNQDGLVDLIGPEGIQKNLGEMKFGAMTPHPRVDPFALADVDLDGQADLVWVEGDEARVRRGSLLIAGGATDALPAKSIAGAPPLVVDIDADGDFDLVGASAAGGLEIWRSGLRPAVSSLRVELEGKKDNAGGRLALVEVRGASHYDRQLYEGEPMVFGFGGGTTPEVVRVTWANGVIQYAILPDADEPVVVRQKEGLSGSCPFLYVHDGQEWRFISDILGITPLGLPMEEGMYVPPDHDELVRIDGAHLKPVDGEYRMQITEELREVTYLDRAELWVVDHDQDVAVHPEERFSFPPFPPQTIHTLADVQPIVKAIDQEGRDWTAALQTVDGEHAVPFTVQRGQFLGLATPHWLEITLPDAVRSASRVRLSMTGWFYWTDASVNVAAGHDARYAFVPPTLHVPDGAGGFRVAGPPLGFPAGKTKTMVLDIQDLLSKDALAAGDLRVRLSSTLRLYWDAIEVVVDDGTREVQVTRLQPIRADLYYRGFSRPLAAARPNQPERFQFDELTAEPVWNQHAGLLTRYGSVLELLDAIDDQYAIFSAGDAVDLRFDARAAPPLAPGRARTFLLFVDGWAKDNDPNTVSAGQVEPLPFHAMTAYPYPASEGYPAGPEHRAYRDAWNTRPGRRLIQPLAPAVAGARGAASASKGSEEGK